MLAGEHRDFWTHNGYLWLRGFLTPSETRELAAWTAEITAWPDTPGRWMRYYERAPGGADDDTATGRGQVLARIENFLPYHQSLAALFEDGRLVRVLTELLGEAPVVFKDKINMKTAGGAGFAPHQDAPAYVDFGVDFHATVMLPVDPFTRENGCLEIAKRAPQSETLPQNPDGTMRTDVVDRFEYVPLLATPGDLIVFDSYVPHFSGPNRSTGPRRSYYVTYNRASAGDHRAAYYARKRQLFPQECEREPGVDYGRVGAQFNLGNPFE